MCNRTRDCRISAYLHSLLPRLPFSHSFSFSSLLSPVSFCSFVFISAELALSHHDDWLWQSCWDRVKGGGGVTQGCLIEFEEAKRG